MEEWRRTRENNEKTNRSKKENSKKNTTKTYNVHSFKVAIGIAQYKRDYIFYCESDKKFIEETIFLDQLHWQI